MDLKDECKDILTKKIIPFWNKLRDDENGGFYGFMDNDLNVDKKADKGVILNSRILWFYSSAYKASICNGEQVAGFKDIHTGKFEEVMLIRRAEDLETFKIMYGIEGEITKEY